MSYMDRSLGLDAAFERIEEAILPDIGAVLNELLETAGGKAGANERAGELRAMAGRVQALIKAAEATIPIMIATRPGE